MLSVVSVLLNAKAERAYQYDNDAVGLHDTPKFDTFYRVFQKASENKRFSPVAYKS